MTAIICHNPLWVSSLYKDHTIPIDYKQLSASCMPTLHDIKTIKKKKALLLDSPELSHSFLLTSIFLSSSYKKRTGV